MGTATSTMRTTTAIRLDVAVARGIAIMWCAAVFVAGAHTARAADVVGTGTAAGCTDGTLNNASQNGDERWAAVISTIGVLRQRLVDRGYPVGPYTDEQIATALLAACPAGGPRLWLTTAHMDETFKYLRKHRDC